MVPSTVQYALVIRHWYYNLYCITTLLVKILPLGIKDMETFEGSCGLCKTRDRLTVGIYFLYNCLTFEDFLRG